MKVTYWFAECLEDSNVYSIRERLKKTAKELKDARPERFGPLVKVTVEYRDAFDLMSQATGEGGIFAEAQATWAADNKEKK